MTATGLPQFAARLEDYRLAAPDVDESDVCKVASAIALSA